MQLYATRLVFAPDLAAAEAQAADELAAWEKHARGERPHHKPPRDKEWHLAALHEVHRRRYLLRASALELFFSDAPPAFLHLRKPAARRRLASRLQYACPRAHVVAPSETNRLVAELTARWQRREVTNFEYLMRLNTLAGRTFNDLNQYPVSRGCCATTTRRRST